MSYHRVVPRDLFNESKLLKCLGRLCLLIHKGEAPECLKVNEDIESFEIDQRASDAGLFCVHVEFTAHEKTLDLFSLYNSKEDYPLQCETYDFGVIDVFNQDGSLNKEFVEYIESLAETE